MSNRINGDFNQESIEAFRNAYASQILVPEDQENDDYTGLPTNVVLNTSPWIGHTGLWKANDGTDKNFVPNQVLVPGDADQEDDNDLTDEELDSILALLEEEGEEEELDLEELSDEELDDLVDGILENSGLEGGIPDEELESIIEELLAEADEEGEDDLFELGDDSDLSDEEVQQMLDELMGLDDDDDFEVEEVEE